LSKKAADSGTSATPVDGAWALWALQAAMLLSAGLAAYLGYTHVMLAHGTGAFESLCSVSAGLDCDTVNTSTWSEIGGVPISLYALPLYGMVFWLAWVGRADNERGRRARGGILIVMGAAVLVSALLLAVMILQVGSLCLFCLALDALHVTGLVLALAVPGNRRPRIPDGLDLFACFASIVLLAGFTFQLSLIWAQKLDRQAAQAVMGEGSSLVTTEVGTEARDGRVVTLPTKKWDVPIDRFDPVVGPKRAKVTVVEFADFECGYCRKLSHALEPLRDKYADRVRFVFKHFPMDTACNQGLKRQHHPTACLAATASICAHDQGSFWEYHDALFKNQKRLERSDLELYAQRLGLDQSNFLACLDGPGAQEQLTEDIGHGNFLEISGTPRTYVNGRLFKGAVSTGMLEAAIQLELGEAEAADDGRVRTRREVVTDQALPAGPVAMVSANLAGRDYWIDAVEAGLDADGRAVAVGGGVPPNVSWREATRACAASGKRLCSAAEWMTACQGADAVDDDGDGSVAGDFLEGREYPYGDAWRDGFCHDSGDQDRATAVPTGSRPGCRTPDGVYDLTGNLQEWVGADADSAVLMGGAWYYKDKATCGASYDTFGPDMANRTMGFRCCADVEDPAPVAEVEVPAQGASLVGPGDALPPFKGEGLEGGVVDSSSLQGKVGLVNFWASWCGPCRKELPALVALHARLEARGFAVIAVNVDRRPADARLFLKGKTLPFPVLLDPDSMVVGRFDVVSMPTSVLVDRDGVIVDRHAGFSDAWFQTLEARVVELLGP
jgi:protein-disulfide isomerase/peroxiredoxin/uncharacterized membrane protein